MRNREHTPHNAPQEHGPYTAIMAYVCHTVNISQERWPNRPSEGPKWGPEGAPHPLDRVSETRYGVPGQGTGSQVS